MMYLGSMGKNRVALEIAGYQFPENRDNDYDANWLMITIDLQTPEYQWQKTDPALLTWEMQSLINWLEAVNIQKEDWNCINFIEPNLSFCLKGRDNSEIVLGVHLALEFRPPLTAGHEAVIEIDCTHEELKRWTDELKNQLKAFPIQLTYHDQY